MSEPEEPAPSPETPVPSRAARHDRPNAITRGWAVATRRALIVFLGAGVAAEVVALLLALVAPGPRPGVATIAGGGAALLYAFHHVPLVFDVPRSLFPPLAVPSLGSMVRIPLAFAPLTATGLVLLALARGGRAVAKESGGRVVERGLHGMKIALPYGLLMFGFSFALHVRLVSSGSGPAVHPEPLGALLWPLGLAALAGFAGGVMSISPDPEGTWDRRIQGALAGGWRIAWLGLALSFVGLLAVAAAKPDETRSFVLGAFSSGVPQGVLRLGLTFTVIPNMAAWILVPAMGGCTGVSGALSACLLSYRHFAGAGVDIAGPPFPSGALDVPSAPPAYVLFLLAPLIAVVVGGATAARRGDAGDRLEAAGLGAAAGVVFVALSILIILLSQVVVGVAGGVPGFFAPGAIRVGPAAGSGMLIATAWGVAGGALGGWAWWARSARALPGPHEASIPHDQQEDETEPGPEGGEVPEDE